MKTNVISKLVVGGIGVLGAHAAQAAYAYRLNPEAPSAVSVLSGHPLLSTVAHLAFPALFILLGAIVAAALIKPPTQP